MSSDSDLPPWNRSLSGNMTVIIDEPSGGAELDLLLMRKGRRYGFEFKCTDAPRVSKSMHIALQVLNLTLIECKQDISKVRDTDIWLGYVLQKTI